MNDDVKALKANVDPSRGVDYNEKALSQNTSNLGYKCSKQTDAKGVTLNGSFTVPSGYACYITGLADDTVSFKVYDSNKQLVTTGKYGDDSALWLQGLGSSTPELKPGKYSITATYINTHYYVKNGAVDIDGFNLYLVGKQVAQVASIELYNPTETDASKQWINLSSNTPDILNGSKFTVRVNPTVSGYGWPSGKPVITGFSAKDITTDKTGPKL
jgi:hypothetical protein